MISNPNGMPQMSAAFAGWMQKITLVLVTQTIVDGLTQDTDTNVTFNGTVQPLTPEEIILKPEGQRAFQWLDIHCMGKKSILKKNDRIVYNGQRYKVMAFKDYSLNNYTEYHAIEDYQDGTV